MKYTKKEKLLLKLDHELRAIVNNCREKHKINIFEMFGILDRLKSSIAYSNFDNEMRSYYEKKRKKEK